MDTKPNTTNDTANDSVTPCPNEPDPEFRESKDEDLVYLNNKDLEFYCFNVIAEYYLDGKTGTYAEILEEMSYKSGFEPPACAVVAADLMQNSRPTDEERVEEEGVLMLSTCVVDENGLPRAAYFKFAVENGYLTADASTHDKLKFWLARYERIAHWFSVDS